MIKGALILATGISFGFSAGVVMGIMISDNHKLSDSIKSLTRDDESKAWSPGSASTDGVNA
jgi:hypothetical protein